MGMAATDSQFHVLAVDDSIIDRKLIERLLKSSSYQVTTVDSGSKALEFLGLYEDDQSSSDSPSVSPNNQQESSSLRNIPVVIMSSENVPSRINRCLEEGAEEFFLKPVRLSDLSRLRPHLMKAKSNNQNQEKQEDESESSETQSQEQEQEHHELEQQQQQQPQLQLQPIPPNSNKRKAVEEGFSPDRTRPIYSGIATLV